MRQAREIAVKPDIAVLVGRFQTPYLHDGHIEFLNYVTGLCSKVIIFLGISSLRNSRTNPYDFQIRKMMIESKYPNAIILPLRDIPVNDHAWSKQLDQAIQIHVGPNQKVALFGSRNCFIPHYHGKHETVELIPELLYNYNATEIRERCGKEIIDSVDFRKGVAWGPYNRYPAVVTTVDVAILNETHTQVLLGRKEHEPLFRFIGGFSDVGSTSFEMDARREADEETNISVTDPIYVGSYNIDGDLRYINEVDKIRTLFFIANYQFGKMQAKDDIFEVRWFEVDKLKNSDIMPLHNVLLSALQRKLNLEIK